MKWICSNCKGINVAFASACHCCGLLVAIGTMTAGCTSTYVSYDTPSGSKLSIHRRSLLNKVEMPGVKFLPDGSVEMVGYKNDQSAAVSEAVEAACKGAVKGALK